MAGAPQPLAPPREPDGGGLPHDARAGLEELAASRARTLALVEGLSQERLDCVPRPGCWSIGEVLDHLLLTDAFYRGEIEQLIDLARSGQEPVLRRSLSELDISFAFMPRALLPWLDLPLTVMSAFVPRVLRDTLLRSRLLPARNPAVSTPRRNRPAAELRAELAASLASTQALFAHNADLDFRRLVHQHPLMGTNDALELLRILTLHEERHLDQIREALGA